ncbi:MAG: 50S ribosomal protein L15 [Gemmatimonadetes bacterium GWC2_71_10]|nr:MAG: 50S ribosomal protein L15 [Gemmatimonadetes bacterium GWC2_71_10]
MAGKTQEPVTLSNLAPAHGSTTARKRKGRGPGSGLGKTAGKGHKGQKARSGGQVRPGFEGGQMPLIRRVPKRGFTNPFKETPQVVNLKSLDAFGGTEVTIEKLVGAGLVGHPGRPVKILGDGAAPQGLVLKGLTVSASARAKIEAAGGRVEA